MCEWRGGGENRRSGKKKVQRSFKISSQPSKILIFFQLYEYTDIVYEYYGSI